jgi:hypothetical protein
LPQYTNPHSVRQAKAGCCTEGALRAIRLEDHVLD